MDPPDRGHTGGEFGLDAVVDHHDCAVHIELPSDEIRPVPVASPCSCLLSGVIHRTKLRSASFKPNGH